MHDSTTTELGYTPAPDSSTESSTEAIAERCPNITCGAPLSEHRMDERGAVIHPPTPGSFRDRSRKAYWAGVREAKARSKYVALHPAEFQPELLAVITTVGSAHKATGQGPTWGEVAQAHGWDRFTAEAYIRALARLGWLVLGTEPRSLRVATPEERRAAQVKAAKKAKRAAQADRDAKKAARL